MSMLPEVASGLLCGALFGYVLENAGFGSPVKLTAQFRLTDWSVFKVMFTAIVVAAAGLLALEELGVVAKDAMFVPPALLGAAAIGGALIGAGFAVGGYCPGTSMVGMVSGRLDALAFVVGLVIGTLVFALGFGIFGAWVNAGEFLDGDTLSEALNVSAWVVVAALAAAAIAGYAVAARFESGPVGPLGAEQAVAGAQPQIIVR
jgi:hypothetical protein